MKMEISWKFKYKEVEKFDLRIDSSDIDNGKFTLGKEVNIDFSKIENGDIKDINTIDLGAKEKINF
ncbi:hypothetical protein ACN2CX_00085 [Aliarcobacter butzleri]|uniref:hypothetical protein n=1 Tax=Aliarcobacter butzleri TaxID=28197 RepID=UPI003AFA1B99